MARGVRLVALLVLGSAAQSRAQEPRPPLDEPHARLVLRAEVGLQRLAERVARVLSVRLASAVDVGEPEEAERSGFVPEGYAVLTSADGRVRITLGGPHSLAYSTDVEVPAGAGPAAVRAVALAIESLCDAVREPSNAAPRAAGNPDGPGVRWRVIRPFEQRPFPWRPQKPLLPMATPTLYLRTLLGVSPVRGTLLLGVGTGLGLCVTQHCLVLEGDLPLLTEERAASDGARVRYRFVNFSMRFQFRPWSWGDWTPAGTFGLVTRVGTASLVGVDTSRVATDVGVRGTLELGWRFATKFEAVLETGLDYAIDRAVFRRHGEVVLLEDRWTPWVVVSARLRP